LAEVFGLDTADHLFLLGLYRRYRRSLDEPSAFEDALNDRDEHGCTPLHRAVMQGKKDVVEFFCLDCKADAGELVAGVGFREVFDRSIGVRNRQAMLDSNPYAGRNALTLAIACRAGINLIHFLADRTLNGQKLACLRDGRGDTAVCLAIEQNVACVGQLVFADRGAGRLANEQGVKPLELAIRKGQVGSLNAVIFAYLLALSGHQPYLEDVARADLRGAARLVATCWTDLPNREAILACLVGGHVADVIAVDGSSFRISVCPVQHCVTILFWRALKLIGSRPDSIDLLECCTAADLGKRDYSLIQALLKHKAHLYLADQGEGLLRWALDHMNDILADLCRKAGIRHASPESSSDDDSGSYDESGSDDDSDT
jgi:hypothetical protein